MNKSVKKVFSLTMCLLMAFSTVACKEKEGSNGNSSSGDNTQKEQKYDPETRPVVFSTEAPDKNFNPFFATSGTDTEIIAQTQIGMLTTTTNDKGEDVLVCGNDWNTVALDYNITENKRADETIESTTYEFIIKNGIRFSDGVELTIKDVLFNLYVYLDPQYTGSATLYSTKIQGLSAYRYQMPGLASGDDAEQLNAKFESAASTRLNALLDYLAPDSSSEQPELTAQIESDIALTKELFKKEVTSDWNNNAGSVEGYENEYRFTEDWEVFYYNEGIISDRWERVKKENDDGEEVIVYEKIKDSNGKFYTTLDTVKDDGTPFSGSETTFRADMEEKVASDEWKAKAAAAGVKGDKEVAEWIKQNFAIETVYGAYTSDEKSLATVLSYWATGNDVYDKFLSEAKSEHFNQNQGEDGGLKVKTISGIDGTKTTTKDFDGNDLGEEHSVLTITIDGVDPKAIYNFSFSVAPMHYYSGSYAKTDPATGEKMETIDYVKQADGAEYFGVCFGDSGFFEEVLGAADKTGVPVGAGAYKASTLNGGAPTKETFCENNWIYFERNDQFYTVLGNNDKDDNAEIKYLRYKVVGSSSIINALAAKEIDIGEPNATPKNLEKVGEFSSYLGEEHYTANGYGYVGINPKYVPDIEIRRAIMKSMNTNLTVSQYYQDLATVIRRPMSTTSWAYPKDDTSGKLIGEYNKIAYTSELDEIRALVTAAGWSDTNGDGIAEKDGKTLEFTFTISGETEDHPAYAMFEDAAQQLNQCGFKITVKTDPSALKKLATGSLQVWAAAWSSTIDPDMYQVYHKDSTATSTLNWGYKEIFADTTGQFEDEQKIINTLSGYIEDARETTNQTERTRIYAKCLDLVMDLCVELPTYQRCDLVVYNKDLLDQSTFYQGKRTANTGLIDKIWELNYN